MASDFSSAAEERLQLREIRMNEEVRQRELDREMKIKENEKDRQLIRDTALLSAWSMMVPPDSTAASTSVCPSSSVYAMGDGSFKKQQTIEVQYYGTCNNDENTDSLPWPTLITFTDFSSLERLSHFLIEVY